MLDNLGTKSGHGLTILIVGLVSVTITKSFIHVSKILIDEFSSFTSFLVKTKRERL